MSDNETKTPPINGDLSIRVSADTQAMDWSASPSGTVWRRRVHRVGPAESGQVTSVVRYEPGATFPSHDHPGGEEILVLQGVFSDEHGDWPQGTYLLNPEGFRHAPFSKDGCEIFVKLRQYPGTDRDHVTVQTHGLAWRPNSETGVEIKNLYAQSGFTDRTRLERWLPGAAMEVRHFPQGAELFVLGGNFRDGADQYNKGSWLRLPVGESLAPQTESGCTLYIKEGGFNYLNNA